MKKLSIKAVITLWYTVTMVIIAVVALLGVMIISRSIVANTQKNDLKATVEYVADDIYLQDGKITFDPDFKSFFNNTHISVYNSDGQILLGKIPSGFDSSLKLSDSVTSTQGEWYVYDLLYKLDENTAVWLRGISPHAQSDSITNTFIKICAVFLPLLVAVSAAGGWLLTRKAFKPIAKINKTAEQISSGKDLSKRIELDGGNDEIHDIAHTFNRMFSRLEDAFENEKRFTAEASHELRTPTSVILAQCEYAMNNDIDEDEKDRAIQTVFSQAKKMSALISQLLLLARADNSSKALHLDTVNISELAEIVAEQQEHSAKQKNITISTDIQPDITIKADETMMMRLLINLTENSVKYGKEGGNTNIAVKTIDNKTVISVSDNGIGIAPEHQSEIWKRFYRVDKARNKTDDNSTGLGLPMVKWIAEAHGGTVDVTSEIDKGSTFTVII